MLTISTLLKHSQVWIGYADQMANPGDIFKFLHKNKIGAKVALFWVAWAFVAEKVRVHTLTLLCSVGSQFPLIVVVSFKPLPVRHNNRACATPPSSSLPNAGRARQVCRQALRKRLGARGGAKGAARKPAEAVSETHGTPMDQPAGDGCGKGKGSPRDILLLSFFCVDFFHFFSLGN
jgi:hypothetical protein